jgi:amino acid transporter
VATSGTGLARGAIGLREVLFQSVTSMAPAGAVALSIAAGATYEWGWPFTATWVIFMIVGAILVAALNYRGIQVSARAGTLLGLFEILVFVALAIWLIVKAGHRNTLDVFTLHFATIKGYHGFSGIAAGSIYTILAFIGFEASAPLAEEARDPKRTIQIAVVASCLVIGLFYVFTTYAGDVFTGPDKFVSFGSLGGGSPWIQLGRDAWGLGWVVAFLAIVNSTFANGNAGTLATTRTWYAMARIGLLPSPLARLHPKWNSPSIGVVVQLVLTLAVGLPIGLHFGPTTAFVFLATILTGIMIAIYMVFNLSCLLYYLRKRRQEFNVLLHAVIPVLGIVAFIPAWLTALGIGSSFLKFVTPLSYPASETGLIIGIWFVIGLIVLAYLYARHPERLPEMKKVFSDDVVPEPTPSGGAA